MVTKTFLITSTELAAHTREKQQLVFDMLNAAHETYPELTIPQLLEYTQQWVSSVAEGDETWDYVDGLAALLAGTEETVEEGNFEEEPENIENLNVDETVEETPTEAVNIIDIEEPVEEELPVENIIEDDDEPLNLEEYEEEEENDEDEEVDFSSNIESSSTVSRQKRWNGLLQEAGKLDH